MFSKLFHKTVWRDIWSIIFAHSLTSMSLIYYRFASYQMVHLLRWNLLIQYRIHYYLTYLPTFIFYTPFFFQHCKVAYSLFNWCLLSQWGWCGQNKRKHHSKSFTIHKQLGPYQIPWGACCCSRAILTIGIKKFICRII